MGHSTLPGRIHELDEVVNFTSGAEHYCEGGHLQQSLTIASHRLHLYQPATKDLEDVTFPLCINFLNSYVETVVTTMLISPTFLFTEFF